MNTTVSALLFLLLLDSCPMVFGAPSQGQKSGLLDSQQKKQPVGKGEQNRKIGRRENNAVDSTSSVVDKLLVSYNRQESPNEEKPTEVQIGIYVISFYSVSEKTMDYTLSMYLKLNWQDPRLIFEPIGGKINSIRLGDGRWDDLWTPDVFFVNEKRSGLHSVVRPNTVMKLNTSGHVSYVTKISTTLSCPMELHRYPLDTQLCPMEFESFGYTIDTMYFSWLDPAVEFNPRVSLPQHTITNWTLSDCSVNYPCLEIGFVLQRDVGYYVIQVFMPSSLIVVLSWVSFWINIDKVAERVSLGLVIILTMTTWSTGIQSSLPHVSYIKAIDVWISMCLTFVFASLVEVGVVKALSMKKVEPSVPVSQSMALDEEFVDVGREVQTDNTEGPKQQDWEKVQK